MFINLIAKKLSYLLNNIKSGGEKENNAEPPEISEKLKENLDRFRKAFGNSTDIKFHEFLFGQEFQFSGALLYVDGLVDNMLITESIIKPILQQNNYTVEDNGSLSPDLIKKTILCNADTKVSKQFNELVSACLAGNTILIVEGIKQGIVIGTKGWDKRSVSEPQTESVVRGPREGFTENLRTNTSLLRRKIKSPALRMENFVIGKKTSTDVTIVYIEGVARHKVVETLRTRLNAIDVDAILDAGFIEEYIEDAPYSIFSTVSYTEKPDVAAGKILEGRIAIIIDGSPFVLTVPMLFIEGFQTAEDYYNRPIYASITRLMRLLCYLIAVFAVPSFIALTTFHQEFLPTTLLFTIAVAREGTPFPVLFEALIMVVAFEILREAGLRLPRHVGQAMSIVGALIMGDAAVSAGLVGTPIVITVAIAAVSGFTIPAQADSISILRIILMLLSSAMGFFGVALGFLGILIHLATLSSFGTPYFSSVFVTSDQQDTFIRMPLWFMEKRPVSLAGKDKKRKIKFVPPAEEGIEK